MADALCGPSNALQSFQKHSQVDRTLQQDRLTGPKHSAGQGFRSYDPRAGSLDVEFHAFENAQPHPFMADESHVQQPFYQRPAPSHLVGPVPTMNWATDFQQLKISDQPIPAQQFRVEAPLVRSTNGGWQNEFMRQRQNGMNTISHGKQAAFDHQQQMETIGSHQLAPFQGFQQQQFPMGVQYGQADFEQRQNELGSMQQIPNQGSAQDWSRAFEEALETSTQTETTTTSDQQHMLHEDGVYTNDRSQMDVQPAIHQPENIRIGSDAIEYTEMGDRTDEQNAQDAGALARVAGELLHNVQHENDNKFQNSQFLDLMRRIRDRQVEVRNNDFETIQGESVSAQRKSETLPSSGADQKEDSFVFPDMNVVNAPHPEDLIDYGFDSDQYSSQTQPMSQMQDLHPGGRLYPGSPEPQRISMSGGIIPSADNFGKSDPPSLAPVNHQPFQTGEGVSLA